MSCQAALLLLVLELNEVNFPIDEHLSSSEGIQICKQLPS